MARPTDIEVGRGVKLYRAENNYGREEARCIGVDNTTGIINARTVKNPKTYRDVPHCDDTTGKPPIYWTELPIDYVIGSQDP